MVKYADLLRESALRVNAVIGSTPADKTTSLAFDPLTAAQIGSVEFPLTALHRAVLSGVARVVRAYAGVKNHPLRLFNLSLTASITNKGAIPSTNAVGKSIIGTYGNIIDASDNTVLTEQPKQIIESINRSKSDGTLKREYYYYALEDGIITHTRTGVKIKVVTFEIADEKTKLTTANSDSPIPDSCFDIAWCAALALLSTDSGYLDQAASAETYVQNQLNAMANGATTFQPAPEFTMAQSAAS